MNLRGETAVVCGAGGFIGGHLVKSLVARGINVVRAVDIKPIEEWHQVTEGVNNVSLDLKDLANCRFATLGASRVYQLAADMGGMGFIESNRALCMLNVLINTHMLLAARENGVKRYFYSSSACVYASDKQIRTDVVALKESDAHPASPEPGYGWEKLFSEHMCRHFEEDYGLMCRVARYHNVYGPHGTWSGGREKAPAAICRKVIEAKVSGNHEIEIWGDGTQTRSFMHISDCIEGTHRIMESDVQVPLNLGSSELVSINQLVDMVEEIASIKLQRKYNLDAPKGVNGRNSDNSLILDSVGWAPSVRLRSGLDLTYQWIEQEIQAQSKRPRPLEASLCSV